MNELTAYLSVARQFKLGEIETETQHHLSKQLSQQAASDLDKAIDILKQIDLKALNRFKGKADYLTSLKDAINDTLNAGHNIYLCGCGSTGRLSLSLEVLCREGMLSQGKSDRVIGFMAGGDTALIRSIENFEDYPEFGARQLEELNYKDGDLLISTTEGGETSFVIGATEYAARVSSNKPWFLYCNPDQQLIDKVERSRRVIENEDINKINLAVGPQAIAGSTRMQASTVLMAAVGLTLMCREDSYQIYPQLNQFIELVEGSDFSFLNEFIEAEAKIYKEGGNLIYKTDGFGITVLTDTTERAPTFSYQPFENYRSPEQPACLSYLMMDGAKDAKEAWMQLLHREPRCIEWDEYKSFAGLENFYGYDISEGIIDLRKEKTGKQAEHIFEIMQEDEYIRFQLGELKHEVPIEDQPPLSQHLLLKLMLNTHSTLVMGKMGRYSGNLMTYVKPSNYKLIDRSIRYVQILYEEKTGNTIEYERVAEQVFKDKDKLRLDEPIVMKTLANLLKN